MRIRLVALIGVSLLFAFTSATAAKKKKEVEIPAAKPEIKGGAWAELLEKPSARPRILGGKTFLEQRRKDYPDLYKRVQVCKGDTLQAAGIVYALEGLPDADVNKWLDLARANVKRGATNVHQDTWLWMQQVAWVYDFFYDKLEASERKVMADWLNANLASFTDDESAFHNSCMSKIWTYLHCAYATWGENDKAQEFRDKAIGFLYEKHVLPVLLEFGAGGGGTECGWYLKGALWNLVQGLELARRIEGYDGFAKAQRFFYQRLSYELFQPYPGKHKDYYGAERFPLEGDGAATYGGHCEYPMATKALLAAYFKGTELSSAISNFRRRGGNPQSDVNLYLWDSAPDKPTELARLPLAHCASGIGKVFARSDWGDDATWFRFECSDYWSAHQHFDVGNFEIFHHESLATESGEYATWGDAHAMNWLVRTVAHNCILVHDPDEQWQKMRDGGSKPYANDGGQAKKWEWPVSDLDTWQKRKGEFERGELLAYQNTDEWLFVAADCTAAYSPKKLKKWVREIVYIRPGTFVIYDEVESTRADFEKTWLLHSRNAPAVDGLETLITNGAGQLHTLTLLPEDAKLATIEGYTYGGQTFEAQQSGLNAFACKWRLEVTPAKPSTKDVFLHVLSTTGKPEAEVKTSGGKVTVKVTTAEKQRFTVEFKGDVGGELSGAVSGDLEAGLKLGPWE